MIAIDMRTQVSLAKYVGTKNVKQIFNMIIYYSEKSQSHAIWLPWKISAAVCIYTCRKQATEWMMN